MDTMGFNCGEEGPVSQDTRSVGGNLDSCADLGSETKVVRIVNVMEWGKNTASDRIL